MDSPEKAFLVSLFNALNEQGVKYVVLRGSESLPESFGGSDIDIFTMGDAECERLLSITKEVASKYNGHCTGYYFCDSVVSCWGGRLEDGRWWGGHIDVVPSIRYRGIKYIDEEMVFRQRRLVKGVYYMAGDLTIIGSFIKEILLNFKTRKDYYHKAIAAYGRDPQCFRHAIERCSGEKIASLFVSLLSEERDAEYIYRQSRKIVRSLIWRKFCEKGGLSFVVTCCFNLYYRYRRVFCRPGFCIAFLGTDGSGKSTLIKSVVPFIERMLHSDSHYEHLRPNFLPALASLTGRKKSQGPVINPHGGRTAGLISSMLRFFYYFVDYTVGYYCKIFPMLVRRPALVVFDRYYYEYMIDPRRCAVRLPWGVARFFSWFIPKPDLILCLGGEPEKIYTRKPETSLNEVKRQVAELKGFCNRIHRAEWVDTTVSVEESTNRALEIIMERMASRCV